MYVRDVSDTYNMIRRMNDATETEESIKQIDVQSEIENGKVCLLYVVTPVNRSSTVRDST